MFLPTVLNSSPKSLSPDNIPISPDSILSYHLTFEHHRKTQDRYRLQSCLGSMSLAAFGASQYNHFATPSSSDPTNLRDTNAEPGDPSSPSNPFANLDPQLHPEILNNETEGNNSPPVENRLNDFAQHVLEVHDDAAHILDFTAGEEEVLFGANQAHQSFGGLLEATGQTLSDEEDRKHDEYGGEGVDGSSGHDGADDTPGGRLRSGGRKRRREADDGENGATMDPIKVKKDSHVRRLHNQWSQD